MIALRDRAAVPFLHSAELFRGMRGEMDVSKIGSVWDVASFREVYDASQGRSDDKFIDKAVMCSGPSCARYTFERREKSLFKYL